ncbi:MAG TPA: hypothetical protein VFB94_06930 [Acidimicrobiales bacterium]|nr:hypothetical protein [Acidimicrobiales bacterium]
MTTTDGTIGRYLRWLVVALSLAAGAIHFAEVGEHFNLSWKHGVFFAVVAWLQIAWAVAFLMAPTRKLLAAAAIGNTFIVLVWAMSRIWGVPIGPGAWEPEPVALADALATAFEVVIVGVSAVVLFRPAVAQRTLRPSLGLASIGVTGVAIAVVSTMALAPSFASEHSHGEADDGHDNEAAMSAPGHDHEAMTAEDHDQESGDQAGGETAAATPEHQEGHTDVVIAADGSSACEQSNVAVGGNAGHGHRGPVPFEPMDAATRTTLSQQIAAANAVVIKYPTVAAAEAGGYRRITPYVPCIAAHYLNGGLLDSTFDPANPEILLFAGTAPDSPLVGLSFLDFNGPGNEPEGFAGKTDPWHVHSQLCIGGGGGVLGDENTDEGECEARGGRVVPLQGLWMSHMWNVPGWESRWGLFSSEHPDLGGRIGDINAAPAAADGGDG